MGPGYNPCSCLKSETQIVPLNIVSGKLAGMLWNGLDDGDVARFEACGQSPERTESHGDETGPVVLCVEVMD